MKNELFDLTQFSIDEILLLDNQVCFPLYVTAKEVVNAYRPFLEAIDLTYTQYIVMMVLWEVKSLSVRELGRRLSLDSGTLTPVLKKLEKKGVLTRTRSREDERVVDITITQAGMDLKMVAAKVPEQMNERVQGFSLEEFRQLRELLNKLQRCLAAGEEKNK